MLHRESGQSEDEFHQLYRELRRIAGQHMRRQGRGHTLSPTALVHEAVARVWASRTASQSGDAEHLKATLALAMKQILVDHSRRKRSRKRDGGGRRISLSIAAARGADRETIYSAVELGFALEQLEQQESKERFRTFVFRAIAEMTIEEVAAVEGCSLSTVNDRFHMARTRFDKLLRAPGEA